MQLLTDPEVAKAFRKVNCEIQKGTKEARQPLIKGRCSEIDEGII